MTGVGLKRIVSSVAAAVLLAAASPSRAQTPNPPPAGRPNRPGAALTNVDLSQILDAYAIVQAQNALQLNEEQYGRFVSRLNRLQDLRRRNLQERNRLMQQLRKLATDPNTEDSVLREQLKALRDLEDQWSAAVRREYDAIYEVLDPRQQVRFRLFEEQLERRKLDLLMRARERANRTAAPAGRNDGGK
jgi:flagellar biosynthesis chaperone FliJ